MHMNDVCSISMQSKAALYLCKKVQILGKSFKEYILLYFLLIVVCFICFFLNILLQNVLQYYALRSLLRCFDLKATNHNFIDRYYTPVAVEEQYILLINPCGIILIKNAMLYLYKLASIYKLHI